LPHFILEYTDNLKKDIDIKQLLKTIHSAILEFPNLLPISGLRSRAIEVNNYMIADGTEDDAFIHATLKLGKGRTEDQKKAIGNKIFQVMKEYLTPIYEKRYLAVSLEIYEFQQETYKWNNIHHRFKQKDKPGSS